MTVVDQFNKVVLFLEVHSLYKVSVDLFHHQNETEKRFRVIKYTYSAGGYLREYLQNLTKLKSKIYKRFCIEIVALQLDCPYKFIDEDPVMEEFFPLHREQSHGIIL